MTRARFCLLALALAGCNPNDFGGTLDRAPVQLIDRPSGFGDNGGRVLLPLAPPADNPKAAARLLFAGTDFASLAVADFDGDGKPSVTVADDDEIGGLGLGAGITSMASLPTLGTVVLGVAEHYVNSPREAAALGRLVFARVGSNAEGEVSFSTVAMPVDGYGSSGHLGMAVARGQVTQGTADEVVAVSDNAVSVFSPPKGPTERATELAVTGCMGTFSTPDDHYRALAVANFLKDGQQEIALGLPLINGLGRVMILQYVTKPATPTAAPELSCVLELRAPDAGVQALSGFGASVAAVPDVDGDGFAELLVGAPPDRAYLYSSAGGFAGAPKVFNKGDTLSEFGQRVIAMDIDLDGKPELGITALMANTKKTSRAGEVFFYKVNGDGVTPLTTLFDSNAVANKEFFGIGLADLEFNGNRVCGKGTPTHVPVVGADKGIFTFYQFMGGPADPRCFAQ
jgi:hypothetical protein